MSWLSPHELRVGLGCMRLSTDADRDDVRAEATVNAALAAGITVFDTAHAYGHDERELGHNEALLGRLLKGKSARVVTKGGMRRPHGCWVPDGRAKALREDCEASLRALDGVPIDLYFVHAPDPKVPWATTVRALAELLEQKLVRRIGVSNVSRDQLDEACALAPIAAVQQGFSLFDDTALRSGVVGRCLERGLTLIAHSPLGGVKKAAQALKAAGVQAVAARHGVSAAQVALAALLDLSPNVVVIPGARRPETARDCALAAKVKLVPGDFEALRGKVGAPAPAVSGEGEVVMVMGVQGSGKTSAVERWTSKGYARLNRDDEGGTLRELAQKLQSRLAKGERRFVLDNTFVTRASRRDVLEAAAKHGVPVRGIWIEIPTGQAQLNVVLRMLAAHRRLLEPDELARGRDPTMLSPNAYFRTVRQVEPPSADEGFATLEVETFARRGAFGSTPARLVNGDALFDARGAPVKGAAEVLRGEVKLLVYAWKPDASQAQAVRVCRHSAGPPVCWCRPPAPGLIAQFALAHDVDLAKSVVVGRGAAHRTLADVFGARFEELDK